MKQPGGWLRRFALDRPDARAWALYDWANSAFWASIIQIFPFYYVRVAHEGTPAATANGRYAAATTVAPRRRSGSSRSSTPRSVAGDR